MKKFLFLFLCSLVSLTGWAQFSGAGSGTESDPYKVYDPIHLAQMANFLNQEGVIFELKSDIDLTEFIEDNYPNEGWLAIGTDTAPFKGTLRGNNRTIRGLVINRPNTQYVGLFGYLDGAKIENLTLITSTVKGGAHTGAFAGYTTRATLTNIHVTATGVTGGNYTGGFIGQATNSTINTLMLTVSSTGVTGGNNTGGAFGQSSGICEAANVETAVSGSSYVGGFVGSTGADFTNCSVTGNVVGTSSYVGGFAGSASTSVFTICNQYGDVHATGCVGGFCGNSSVAPTFTDCKSKGMIISTADYVGGILGYGDFVSMTNCSHFGDIQGTNYVGGVYGGNPPQTQEDYPVYNTSRSTTSNTQETTWNNTSSFEPGNVNIRYIDKCTATGNINGVNKIGGLVGSHEANRTFRFYSAVGKDKVKDGPINTLWRNNSYLSNVLYYSKFTSPYSFYSAYDVVDYVDYTTLNVSNSYYSGNVTGTDDVGGLIGNKVCGEIKNCYAYANVVGERNVGGLVGYVKGITPTQGIEYSSLTIKSSAAINTTVNATKDNVGRIYGYKADDYVTIGALGTAEGNLSLNKTSVVRSGVVQTINDDLQNGSGIGQSMLKLKATYVAKGWNFDNDWIIQETECYPYMRYQAAPPVIESNLVSQATSVSGKSVIGGTVYFYYKDNAPASQNCNGGHNWTFTTEPLQSGAEVRLYTEVEGLTPSYYTVATVAYPGSGTEEDPYRIYTAEDLQGMSKQGYYKLMNDIDLTAWIDRYSSVKGWIPVGKSVLKDMVFDGDNHKISGLWMDCDNVDAGLFAFPSGESCIKNLTVEVASGKQVKGCGTYVGIVAGRIKSLENITVLGNVFANFNPADHEFRCVGGVAGGIIQYAENVEYNGTVISQNGLYNGGLFGWSTAEINHCRSTATIELRGRCEDFRKIYAGGICGFSESPVVYCQADVNIASFQDNINILGGVCGLAGNAIRFCSSSGSIKGYNGGDEAGGIVGTAVSTIQDCYSSVDVYASDLLGGIAAYTSGSIERCFASGNLSGTLQGGGIVADLYGSEATVHNCVAASEHIDLTDQSSWASRIIGNYRDGAPDPDNSNYALKTMQVTLNGVPVKKYDNPVEGISREESVLMTRTFYESLGWDMTEAWGIDEGTSYPFLRWVREVETSEYTLGDINSDGIVNVQDYVGVAKYILEGDYGNFCFAAGDIIADGIINVQDYVGVAKIILDGGISRSARRASTISAMANNDYLLAEVQSDGTMSIALDNEAAYTMFQLDVTLPAGATVLDVCATERMKNSHILEYRQQPNGSWRILVGSSSLATLRGHEGSVLTLNLGGLTDGSIVIDNALFVTPSNEAHQMQSVVATVGKTTGVADSVIAEGRSGIYTLQGTRVEGNAQLAPGVYMVNGKKIVVK